jgi:hypothetical protein
MSEAAQAVMGLITMLQVVRYGPLLIGWSMAGASFAVVYAAVTQPNETTLTAAALLFSYLALHVHAWRGLEARADYKLSVQPSAPDVDEGGDCGTELDDSDEIELAQAAGALCSGRINEGRDRFERWLDGVVPHWRDLR